MSDVTDLKAEVLLLRKENKELRADQAHWELGNCPSCPNIANLQEALEQNAKLRALADGAANEADRLTHDAAALQIENAKLREFAGRMANALGIDSEWCDTSWCDTDCMVEFGCQTAYCGGETRCPAWARLRELGVTA